MAWVPVKNRFGAIVKENATTAPGVSNDADEGYSVSSHWIDVNNDKAYVCVDATVGAAVWIEVGGGLSGSAAGGDLGGTYPNPTVTDLTISSEAQGDVLYFNGSNWVRLAAGTSGKFLKTQGAGANPTWDTAGGLPTGNVLGDVVFGTAVDGTGEWDSATRHLGGREIYWASSDGDDFISLNGLVTQSGSSNSGIQDSRGLYHQMGSASAGVGSIVRPNGTGDCLGFRGVALWEFFIRTHVFRTTDIRKFVGIDNEGGPGVMVGSDAPDRGYFGIQYSTGRSDTTFQFARQSAAGGSQTLVDTTVPIDTDPHLIRIEWITASSMRLRMYDSIGALEFDSGTITTNLLSSTADTFMSSYTRYVSTAAGADNLYVMCARPRTR